MDWGGVTRNPQFHKCVSSLCVRSICDKGKDCLDVCSTSLKDKKVNAYIRIKKALNITMRFKVVQADLASSKQTVSWHLIGPLPMFDSLIVSYMILYIIYNLPLKLVFDTISRAWDKSFSFDTLCSHVVWCYLLGSLEGKECVFLTINGTFYS